MKYIISEKKMNKLVKDFIFTTIINPNKIKWIDDIETHHVKNDIYLVEIIVKRKESAEMSAGFGFAWNNFSNEVKRLAESAFGIDISLTRKIGK